MSSLHKQQLLFILDKQKLTVMLLYIKLHSNYTHSTLDESDDQDH
jgi:hypothetical protein